MTPLNVTRILAPNPGPFTGDGTNTYVVSAGRMALIIDPGPPDGDHLEAIRRASAGLTVTGILVTHHHLDHSPAAAPLAAEFGVPSYGVGFGPFQAIRTIADGDRIQLGNWVIETLHTPGHTPDSVCFVAGDTLFSGDTVKSGTTVVVDDMGDYMRSLERLAQRVTGRIYPGHGEVIHDGPGVVAEYVAHRRAREAQVEAALSPNPQAIADLVAAVYEDLDPRLVPLAQQSLTAHLRKLEEEEKARRSEAGLWSVP